jgi:hypothetical protein
MSGLTRTLTLFVSVALLAIVVTTLFAFFGIGFDIYGNYLLWFIALAILYSILPKKSGILFTAPEV